MDRRWTEGAPAVLVQHGSWFHPSCIASEVSPEEIVAEMHKAGLERMEQVKGGVLKTDGTISLVPWEPAQVRSQPEHELHTG